jgi:hypothetical protein
MPSGELEGGGFKLNLRISTLRLSGRRVSRRLHSYSRHPKGNFLKQPTVFKVEREQNLREAHLPVNGGSAALWHTPSGSQTHVERAFAPSSQMRVGKSGMVGGGPMETIANPFYSVKMGKKRKKRSSQASWKHAAWELLSPDLRCFCKQDCGKHQNHTRVLKGCGLK